MAKGRLRVFVIKAVKSDDLSQKCWFYKCDESHKKTKICTFIEKGWKKLLEWFLTGNWKSDKVMQKKRIIFKSQQSVNL